MGNCRHSARPGGLARPRAGPGRADPRPAAAGGDRGPLRRAGRDGRASAAACRYDAADDIGGGRVLSMKSRGEGGRAARHRLR